MKVALYARVSSDAQDVSLSIGAQLKSLREYAARHGLTVVREYVDEAESGRTSARPAFKEMIALAKTKEPPFDTILVWKLNRFSRNRLDSVTCKELLRQRGIGVVSINEPLENNPSGKLLEGIIESMDEFYSANLGQDIKRGLRESAGRGFFVGNRPPYGYQRIEVKDGARTRYKLQPDSPDSLSVRIVRRLFDMAGRSIGTKEIAKQLNNEGLVTSTGAKWTKTYVHKILNNEAYCGTLVLGGRPGHKAVHSGEAPVRVENAWPPIIDRNTFKLVQKKLGCRKFTQIHPRVVPSFYLLSGLLRCGCGKSMIGRSAKSHQYYYYSCNRSVKEGSASCAARNLPKVKLENQVIEIIKSKILADDAIEKLVMLVNEELNKTGQVYHQRLEGIESELGNVNLRLDRHYDALETGKLSLDELAPRIKQLKARQDELSKARLMIEADMATQGMEPLDASQIKNYVRDLGALLADTDVLKSKNFLRTFLEKIIINGTEGKIYYKLPVPSKWQEQEEFSVLPIVPPSGEGGTRTPTHCCTGS
jgi:site-specific DNA recombinase